MSGKFCPVGGCRHNAGGYCIKENGSVGMLPLGLIPQGGIGGANYLGQAGVPIAYFESENHRSDQPGSWENCVERRTIRD